MKNSDLKSMNKLSLVLLSMSVIPSKIVISDEKFIDLGKGFDGRVVYIYCDLRGMTGKKLSSLSAKI